MIRLLINISIICLIVAAFICALFIGSNTIVANKANLKIATNINKIVVGHSHTACAFNDSLIRNFKNFSRQGEPFFYTYFKTVEILKQNPQIDTVFIGVSNNIIFRSTDTLIWGDEYMSSYFSVYAPFIGLGGYKTLCEHNSSGFLSSVSKAIRTNIETIISSDYCYSNQKFGGYVALKSARKVWPETNVDSNISTRLNLQYLTRLVDECKRRHLTPILIRTPLSKSYPRNATETLFQNVIRTRFNRIYLYDFADYVKVQEQFADYEHLNVSGARMFSESFNKFLNDPSLFTQFIDLQFPQ